MSKEHKNKRDTKKKAAMSPKEKKAAKQLKKETKNILGNWTALSGVSNIMWHKGTGYALQIENETSAMIW